MAINITPSQQAIYDNRVTDEPGGIDIPSAEDIANGDATGDDIVVTPPSGLQQDINNANQAILDSDANILKLADEQLMQEEVMNHFHNFLRGYEDEIGFVDGSKESAPWQLSEVNEANNLFNGATTRYFPSGINTTPLTINSFPEETYSASKSTDPVNYVSEFPSISSALDFFVTTWTDIERQTNVTTIPGDQVDFDNDLLAVHDSITAFIPRIDSIISHIAPPFFDDENTGADTAALSWDVKLDAVKLMLNNLNAETFYDDANTVMAFYETNKAAVITDANARIAEIATYNLPAYYTLRATFGVELADYGEGIIWKKLSEIEARVQNIKRRDKLQRKLDAYNDIGGII